MRKLLTRASRLVVLVALLLSGCFRPSGDTIEPTSSGATADTIQQPAGNATATPEAPPITLLSPDVTAAPTLELATQSGPVITEVTVIPFEATSTSVVPMDFTTCGWTRIPPLSRAA